MRKSSIRAEDVRGVSAWRLLVVVASLYAMALGGLLSAAASARAEHANVICRQVAAQDQSGASDDRAPADRHNMSDCCLAVSAASLDLQNVVIADSIWPPQRALGPVRWRVIAGTSRGPPRGAAHPRAPPPFGSIA